MTDDIDPQIIAVATLMIRLGETTCEITAADLAETARTHIVQSYVDERTEKRVIRVVPRPDSKQGSML